MVVKPQCGLSLMVVHESRVHVRALIERVNESMHGNSHQLWGVMPSRVIHGGQTLCSVDLNHMRSSPQIHS
ncbi:unnamed protein product [Sphenostylis stenocarpa]|uniref:Uncharacterized protein n=1 Tax=Sphenostylis stenocarpa TaxID=92480 RepID=A0AA86TAQ4_9FABA|nr:unnamed protein product [Sphenostylis stenocarpa]